MVCRYWAAQLRPALFSVVALRSHKEATTFASLTRSSAAVPAPLRSAVQTIGLYIDDSDGDCQPLLYHFWALLRDSILPNLQFISMGVGGDNSDPPPGRSRCATLLDIGFPRTLPIARPIFHLRQLILGDFKFRSSSAAMRCLAYHCAERLGCRHITWSENNSVTPPARHPVLHSWRCSHMLEVILIDEDCMAVSVLVRNFISARPPTPGHDAPQQLPYIRAAHVNTVMNIFRLFSDECRCGKCKGDEDFILCVCTGTFFLKCLHARSYRLI